MTPETQQLVSDLKELRELLNEKECLSKKHSELIDTQKDQAPRAPLKRMKRSIFPHIDGIGWVIVLLVSLVACIASLVIGISALVKNSNIKDIVENPGEEYNEWCEILIAKGSFDEMTKDEWMPVQKSWKKQGVSFTWNELVEFNTKDEISARGTPEYIREKRVYDIFEVRSEALQTKFITSIVVFIICILVFYVVRGGFKEIPNLLAQIVNIPKIKKQNIANQRYNELEYPKLVKEYEQALPIYNEKLTSLENACKNEMDSLENKIKLLHQKTHDDVDLTDVDLIIEGLEKGWYKDVDDYYLQRFIRSQEIWNSISHSVSSNSYNNHDDEISRHNREMERMEAEHLRMAREKESRERYEKSMQAKQAVRDDYKQREAARRKNAEERHQQERGLRHQCNTCQLSSKCYMHGSFPCPSYRPR